MSEPAAHRSTASPRLFPVGSLFHSLFPHPVPIDHLIGHGNGGYKPEADNQPEKPQAFNVESPLLALSLYDHPLLS